MFNCIIIINFIFLNELINNLKNKIVSVSKLRSDIIWTVFCIQARIFIFHPSKICHWNRPCQLIRAVKCVHLNSSHKLKALYIGSCFSFVSFKPSMANAQLQAVQYIHNMFGRESLVLAGHRFTVENRRKDRVYWRCSIPACPATVNTHEGHPVTQHTTPTQDNYWHQSTR